jgi:hypothetical protein
MDERRDDTGRRVLAGRAAAELSRALELAFSASELVDLATDLRLDLGPVAGGSATARALVREAEARESLPELLHRLALDRPLVEWPTLDSLAPTAAEPAPPAASSEGAPPLVALPAEAPTGGPSAAPWPGTGEAPGGVSIDARLVVAVGALALVGGMVTFFAGHVVGSASYPKPAPSAEANAAAEAPSRGEPRAEPRTEPKPAEPAPLAEPGEPLADLPPEPLSAPPNEPRARPGDLRRPASGAPASPTRAGAPALAAPRAPRGPSTSCLATCSAQHQRCTQACGGEPQEASRYQAYQGCLSRCLSDSSGCRMSCR